MSSDSGSPHPGDARAGVDVGLVVRDLETSLRFYREVIGCEIDGELMSAAVQLVALRYGTAIIKLVQRTEPGGIQPSGEGSAIQAAGHYLTFHVPDPDALVERCVQADVEVVRMPYDFSPTVRNAIVRDPDGNPIELCLGVPWRAG